MLKFEQYTKKNICLIGLMGSGKSLIGRDLSKLYKIKFLDSDSEIENEVGKKINYIFKDHGENFFRQIEEKICLKLLNLEDCVISLGGGSITNTKVRNLIKKNSYSIYLKVNIDILVSRLSKTDKRPLLKNVDIREKLNELYISRNRYYNNANLIIENNLEKNNIIKIIQKEINL